MQDPRLRWISLPRQMIACFRSLHTDFYLELTACFKYFLQVIWLTVAAQGPIMGFFSLWGRAGKGARESQLVSDLTKL